jgi:signal transduction histidine kinase
MLSLNLAERLRNATLYLQQMGRLLALLPQQAVRSEELPAPNFTDMVSECASHIEPLANHERTKTSCVFPEVPVLVSIEPYILRAMRYGLFVHALKYSPPDSQISIRMVSTGLETIQLQVQDQGTAINDIDSGQVDLNDDPVQPAERASAGNSFSAFAAIGLPTIKYILGNNNGKIWIEHTPGRGNTITLMLPIQR